MDRGDCSWSFMQLSNDRQGWQHCRFLSCSSSWSNVKDRIFLVFNTKSVRSISRLCRRSWSNFNIAKISETTFRLGTGVVGHMMIGWSAEGFRKRGVLMMFSWDRIVSFLGSKETLTLFISLEDFELWIEQALVFGPTKKSQERFSGIGKASTQGYVWVIFYWFA